MNNKPASKFNPADPWIEFPPAINASTAEPRMHKYSYLDLNQDIKSALLKTAHNQNAEVRCHCNRQDPQPLSIGKKKGYYLSCYPNTRFKHHMDCPFFGLAFDQSAASAYTNEALNFDEGLIHALLDEPMHTTKREKKEEIPVTEVKGAKKLTQISIKGLMHLVLEEAGLNIWNPAFSKHRNYTTVRRRMFAAISRVTVNDVLMREAIYIPPLIYPNSAKEYIENAEAGKKAYLKKYYQDPNKTFFYGGIVSECIKKPKGKGNSPYYVVKFKHDRNPIFVHPDTMKEINKTLNGFALTELLKRDVKVFLMLRTNIVKGQYFWAKGGAGTIMTKNLIPVQNEVELKFADFLVKSKRYFVKPLLFDADKIKILSDFILLDTDSEPCHIYVNHVLGNIEYQRRKFEARNELSLLHKSSLFWEEDEAKPVLPEPLLKSVS